MKKKLSKILLIILVIFSFCLTPLVKADSGWDSSYDSSSSYDSDSSWSSSSSYDGGSTISGPLDFIYLLAIFIYIIYIMYKSSKVKTNIPNKASDYNEIDDEELKKYNLDKEELKTITYNLYKEIQNAWTDMDYNKLRDKLTDELYNSYTMQLDTLKTKKQKNIMSNFEYVNSKIISVEEINGLLNIKVYLNVKMFDYVVDKNNKILRGTDKHRIDIEYIITLVKTSNNNHDDTICPNCGAKIEGNASGKCEYCGSVVVSDAKDFAMSSKTCICQKFE